MSDPMRPFVYSYEIELAKPADEVSRYDTMKRLRLSVLLTAVTLASVTVIAADPASAVTDDVFGAPLQEFLQSDQQRG